MTDTAPCNGQDLLVELTADIVAAYVSNRRSPGQRPSESDFRRTFRLEQHLGSGSRRHRG